MLIIINYKINLDKIFQKKLKSINYNRFNGSLCRKVIKKFRNLLKLINIRQFLTKEKFKSLQLWSMDWYGERPSDHRATP